MASTSRWGLVGAALLVVACVTGSEVPKAATMHVLTPREGETKTGKAAPFAVVHHGPQGNATSDAVINIVFSRPLRTLEGSDKDTPIPVTMRPELPGKWHWIGTNGVQFQPAGGRLPLGREIQVTVSEQARALDGTTLGKPLTFSFTTPTPYLTGYSPSDGQRSVELRPRIVLDFNQPVEAAEVQRLASIDVEGKLVGFTVEPSKEKEPNRVVLVPKADFPRNSKISIKIPTGLHAIGGDVPSPHEKSFSFNTYGPLTAAVRCGWSECLPESGLTLEFSNPVKLGTLKPRVTIDPAQALTWPDWYSDAEESPSFGVSLQSKPRTRYQVAIAPGLTDIYGQPLQGPVTFTFTTGDYWESLAIGVEGEILQPGAVRALPIRSRNVADYTVELGAADPALVIAFQERPWDVGLDNWRPSVRSRVKPGVTNRFNDHLLDLLAPLSKTNQGQARGAVLAHTQYESRNGYPSTERKLIQVTDLALTAKLSKLGSLVWVTRLSTGAPVVGAGVEVLEGSEVKHRYQTDEFGFVAIPKADFVPQFYDGERQTGLVARHEGDWVAASERSYLGAWRMPIYPTLYETDTREAFLFTERGVYRPGDKVWVKGIVREHADALGVSAGGLVVVSGRRYDVTLTDPNGKEVVKHAVTTNAFGTFAQQLTVPSSAELGTFNVRVSEEGKSEVSSTTFAVAEYEPAEFSVTAEAKDKSIVRGATSHFSTEAAFLYGAPVANAEVHYTLTYEPGSYAVPGAEQFDTSDDAFRWSMDSESPQSGMLTEGDAKLDARGRWALASALDVPGQVGPVNVRFEASVTDVSRKTLSASALTLVHPASFYLGIQRLEDWFVDAPSTVTPNVAAFTITGKRITGKAVTLELIHRRWTSVKEQWDGGYRQVYQRVDDVVGRCALTTGATVQSCPLSLSEGGAYIVRAKAKDEAGRDVFASQEFYAIGGGRVAWRDDAQNATMDIVPNKKVYRAGDTARILVKSPFAQGDAMVTVERAGIIERRKVTLSGATPVIEVPITDQLRPNAYVSVHLVKKRDANSPPAAVGDELYRIGYTELTVDSKERVLQVSVTPKASAVRPRAQVEVDVVVRDAQGKPKAAEVTFYAVDEGVLMLTGYQVPDPVARFTAPRPLQVATLETRANLARIFEPRAMAGSEKGAEGGGGGDVRSDFKQSAYFNPTLTTDEQGRAHVVFQAPDNLTTFRLMAVAVSKDDRYGNGASQVTVNKPLMARPALPRFARAGDKFEAAVAVSTKGAKSKNVDVSIEVGPGLVLRDEKVKRLQVSSDSVQEVRFQVEATQTGETFVQFAAVGEGERDAARLTRVIHSPAQLEAVAAYGETTSTEGQRLGKLEEVRNDVGGLDITLASSRLVGLDGSMEQLVEYPYYCTEQLSSRLLPVLPLSDLAKEFGFETMPDAKGFVGRTVRLILERQHADGGFGFWPESDHTHAYLSAYVLWVLKLAQQKGVSVNNDVFERGVSYLRPIVNHPSTSADELERHGLSRDLQAFTAMVLAELGQPDLGAVERLAHERKELGVPGHAWLLMAAVKSKAPEELRKPLVERLESNITLDGNRAVVENVDGRYLDALLSSELKVQALVLSALLTEKPSHPLAGKLVAELLMRRDGGTWRTTQESAFALLAIDQYWRAQEKATPRFEARVWVGDTPLIRQTFEGRSTRAVVEHVAMAKLTQAGGLDVVFERAGKDMLPASGTLFYEARLKYAPVSLPKVDLDRGFAVQKMVRSVPVSELSSALTSLGETVSTVDAKEMVVVDLLVVAPAARRFVVVDDPLAAGLSAFDSSLATSSQEIAQLEGKQLGDAGVRVSGFSSAWHRRELRDDRALFFIDEMPAGMYHFRYLARAHTPGAYVVPPTRVMEMYQPEVYGRTAATQLTVVTAP